MRIVTQRVPVPESLDAPEGWLLHGAAAVEQASALRTWGALDQSRTAHELLVVLHHQEYDRREILVAVDAERTQVGTHPDHVLGRAEVVLPTLDNTSTAYIALDVRPEARGAGVGAALYQATLDLVRAEGRTALTASTDHGSVQPEVGRIGTWNAEENEHMLAINTALGFRPAGGAGEWQLHLDGARTSARTATSSTAEPASAGVRA